MYVPAFDFKQGLVPYKQIFIAYGYLTTWIQALSLTVLGNSLKSIGIVTGLFYSLSLFFSYRVFHAFSFETSVCVLGILDFLDPSLYRSSLAELLQLHSAADMLTPIH